MYISLILNINFHIILSNNPIIYHLTSSFSFRQVSKQLIGRYLYHVLNNNTKGQSLAKQTFPETHHHQNIPGRQT